MATPDDFTGDPAAAVRRVAELERRLAETLAGGSQYRELFERSADAILIIDGDMFIDCNDATVAMLRYRSKEELLQTHPSVLSPDFQADGQPSYDKANQMMEIAKAQGSHRFEWLHKRADGEVFPVEVLLTAVPQGDKVILHTVWRDITERKQLEHELRQAQKMEAVGMLAGGIAHDFNNLLMAICGNAELLSEELKGQTELKEYLVEIDRAGQRAAALIEQLLAFSRKQILQPRVVDLSAVFRGIERMLGRLLGEDIDIVQRLAGQPLPVMVDPGQLEQVMLNLATNARDAMPDGGTLTFTTSQVTIGSEETQSGALLAPGRYAVLLVSDTGVGIDPEHLERIFEPFYSTKDQGRGTGLGLSTVFGIVKQSGGEVTVSSEPGKGTVFRVFLPLSDQPVQPATGPELETDQMNLRGRETILLVEDEPTLSRLVEKVLKGKGYRVHTAANGKEALILAETLGTRFDLLLTDVIMPQLGGPELAGQLRERRPGLKVLYMSGYTDNVLVRKGLITGEVDLVAKPFSPNELLTKLREVIDRG